MTRKEACRDLIGLCLTQTRDLNEFLSRIQPELDKDDFSALRKMVASILGEILTGTITPIVSEFPDLKPEGLP